MSLDLSKALQRIVEKYNQYLGEAQTRIILISELRQIYNAVVDGILSKEEAEKAISELLNLVLPEDTPDDVRDNIRSEIMKIINYKCLTEVLIKQRRRSRMLSF